MHILFTGGGSGGHVTPITAIARQLKKDHPDEDLKMYFLGAKKFSHLLAFEDIKVKTVLAAKVRRGSSPLDLLKNIIDLIKIPIGLVQSLWWLLYWLPDVVFSKGGYGSIPVVIAAWIYKIPIVIHDSDVIPGRANFLAAKFAKRIIVSFPETLEYFPESKTAVMGLPLRKEMIKKCLSTDPEDKQRARKILNINTLKPLLFIIGGSQGASRLNEAVLNVLPDLLDNYEVIHQCGKPHYDLIRRTLDSSLPGHYHLFPFLEEHQITAAYLLSDLIISRAGSTSIFEIAACQKPSIIIPMPGSSGLHQRENAFAYARTGAAVVIEQQNLSPNLFLREIRDILDNREVKEKLIDSTKSFSTLDADEKITKLLIELAD